VSEAIAAAAQANPSLAVVVVTNRSQADGLLTAGWSRDAFERIQSALPDFELHQLRAHGVDHEGKRRLEDVYIHAKLLIVDDEFLLVGSCNANDRGFEYEGEIDIAVADAALVGPFRVDLWRGHLGGDPRLTGDIPKDVSVWKGHAERNRLYEMDDAAPPESLVFPFTPRAGARTFFARDVF
jgi:phosphatidylserine/phosphatidylglycerophosphate/cardiolipin synthase-like enzyme